MPFAGAKPKEDRSQIRHRNPVLDWTEIPDVPFEGPALPQRFEYVKGSERKRPWPAATLRWWERIRQMPHAKNWSATDWEFAFTTAKQHAKIEETGVGFAELRARERLMGTTLDSRNGMRIRYVKPSQATKREEAGEAAVPANVVAVDFGSLYGAEG